MESGLAQQLLCGLRAVFAELARLPGWLAGVRFRVRIWLARQTTAPVLRWLAWLARLGVLLAARHGVFRMLKLAQRLRQRAWQPAELPVGVLAGRVEYPPGCYPHHLHHPPQNRNPFPALIRRPAPSRDPGHGGHGGVFSFSLPIVGRHPVKQWRAR